MIFKSVQQNEKESSDDNLKPASMALAPKLLTLARPWKFAISIFVDALLCVFTVGCSFYLRLGDINYSIDGLLVATAVALSLTLPVFLLFGLYSTIIRFADWTILTRIGQALLVFAVFYTSIFTVMGFPGVPRTIGLIVPLILFLFVSLSRVWTAYWLGGRLLVRSGLRYSNVLIYGAGSAGQQLASALSRSKEMCLRGFVDDDVKLQGRSLGRLPVFGPLDLSTIIQSREISEILLAIPSASRARRNAVIRSLYNHDVRIRTLPGMMDLAHGRVQVSDIKTLEIEDLLGRDIVAPDPGLIASKIAGRVVLVTGAGGSIGSEMCRQVLRSKPSLLLTLEISEFALYAIDTELQGTAAQANHDIDIIPLIGSVNDDLRIRQIIAKWSVDTVYHAAAYKHVPLVEHNVAAGVENNVIGTRTLVLAARDLGVRDFVLISTDKAVRPTNVMGTTKRLAEMLIQSVAAREPGSTTFSMVRFGNVLGSSGSVVPLFKRQIEGGGPITITHKDMTRYFMTIPEAAQLVIQAGALASGGEVFVLDMGEPVKIWDLARNMVELSGFSMKTIVNPDGDIEIKTIGLRPGEKLYEELLIGNNAEETSHRKIMKANEEFLQWDVLNPELDGLRNDAAVGDIRGVKARLKALVPEYESNDDVVDWIAAAQN